MRVVHSAQYSDYCFALLKRARQVVDDASHWLTAVAVAVVLRVSSMGLVYDLFL